MLDTVILEIDLYNCSEIDFSRFGTTREDVLYRSSGFCTWVNNPTREDKINDIYKPRMTLIRRGGTVTLKLEFSVPKLLFLNNIDEICEEDFEEVINVLQTRTRQMGVKIFHIKLRNAKVLSFHPSKNILLTGGYTSMFALKELSKVAINGHLDFDVKDYRNGGKALQFYSNSHALVFYDKTSDLNKPKNRAIDKDQTFYQQSLFEVMRKNETKLEILRMEVRLSKKKKMDEMLQKVGYSKNPVFQDIVKKDLCQKMLVFYWTQNFSKSLFVLDMKNGPQKILQDILFNNPNMGIKQAVYLTGLKLICKDEGGVKGLRNTMEIYRPKAAWIRTSGDFKELDNGIASYGFVSDIEANLREFRAFKREDMGIRTDFENLRSK